MNNSTLGSNSDEIIVPPSGQAIALSAEAKEVPGGGNSGSYNRNLALIMTELGLVIFLWVVWSVFTARSKRNIKKIKMPVGTDGALDAEAVQEGDADKMKSDKTKKKSDKDDIANLKSEKEDTRRKKSDEDDVANLKSEKDDTRRKKSDEDDVANLKSDKDETQKKKSDKDDKVKSKSDKHGKGKSKSDKYDTGKSKVDKDDSHKKKSDKDNATKAKSEKPTTIRFNEAEADGARSKFGHSDMNTAKSTSPSQMGKSRVGNAKGKPVNQTAGLGAKSEIQMFQKDMEDKVFKDILEKQKKNKAAKAKGSRINKKK